MVVQDLFVVGICALLYGIADMCFPLYTHCTDPVILGWGGGPAGVHRQIRSFRYDFGFLVFYFHVRFAVQISVMDLAVYVTPFYISGFPAAVFSFSDIFASSWHIDLLKIKNFLNEFRPFF